MTNSYSTESLRDGKRPTDQSDADDLQPLVLVVGKESDTLLLYKTVLEMWNYRVGGIEKLEELVETIELTRPDLILMDSTISFADDMKNLCLIRKEDAFNDIPVILTSGHARPENKRTAATNGADDFLLKPISFEMLESSLKRYFRGQKK